MRYLSERSIEFNQDLYVCFIDYKAFDHVSWRKLMEILHNIGVDWWDRRLIATLYMSQTAAARLNYELTGPSQVGKRSLARLSDFSNTVQCLCGSHDEGSIG